MYQQLPAHSSLPNEYGYGHYDDERNLAFSPLGAGLVGLGLGYLGGELFGNPVVGYPRPRPYGYPGPWFGGYGYQGFGPGYGGYPHGGRPPISPGYGYGFPRS
ncbi:hypothetical protein [Sediminibacillus albus]|uniref:Uncharacterized protein n=1 Tax=Sediminibacillus albus TaxID=407036 RepID=A0A1G8VTD0_9BACI|nr:hypothetical protein [Sediminibacillus albus]SDJ69113.1 hypothetical protein SAMN05216243_0332 [Sediminibacillus albus]